MKRKIAVKAIAIIFMSLGIWYLGLFFLPFFDINSDKNLNLVYLIYTSFLLQAGWGLFKLKESGRSLVLFLLALRAITNLVVLTWVLFFKEDKSSLIINFLGKPFFNSENLLMFAMILLAWLFVVLLMMAFLLQRETGEIFSPEENTTTSQSKVMS